MLEVLTYLFSQLKIIYPYEKHFTPHFLSVTLLTFLLLVLQNKAVYNDLEIQQLHINVDHAEGLYFVDDKIIENLVMMKVDSVLGTSYEDINIFMLEEFWIHILTLKKQNYI